MMKNLLASVVMLIGLGMMNSAFAAPTVTFHNPKVGGVALDWCKTWSANCGKPAADYFCKSKGYKKSVLYQKENNIGYTRILKTGQICNAPGCDSFKKITCKKKALVQYKRFAAPKYRGVALDWCYTWLVTVVKNQRTSFVNQKDTIKVFTAMQNGTILVIPKSCELDKSVMPLVVTPIAT